ncbi:MAG: carbamate kinase [Actinomycetota bacterium]|nr:carbamate kinase [Actinomycetota bacterium]
MMYMASAIRRDGSSPSTGPDPIRPLAVVAVGGNALTAAHQSGAADEIAANATRMARSLAHLAGVGWRLAVVHGNGPQVGNLSIQQEEASAVVPAQPLHQLAAMTQGQLGGVLVREIDRLCGPGTAVAVVTHVQVDRDDPAFAHPTKPIGPFFTADRAAELARLWGWHVVEDSGRGYRRVVTSPAPIDIVEMEAIRLLLAAGHIVLAAGGGGIAVSRATDGGLTGVDAVIDKDHSAAVLAAALGARELYLLTGVDTVLLDFGTPHERPVHVLTPQEAAHHMEQGQFPAGSMGPKIGAALRFLREGGQRVFITSADRLADVAAGYADVGTRIESVPAAIASVT